MRLFNDPSLKTRRLKLRKSQTDAERKLWSHLRSRQLHGLRFVRQYSVGSCIVDFFCPGKKLAIELDGGQHFESNQANHDQQRTQLLNVYGIIVIRFWNHEVMHNIEGVLERIEAVVLES